MASPGTAPSTRQVVLGLFIICQLAFLFVSNGLELAMYARGRFSNETEQAIELAIPGMLQQRGHVSQLLETVDRGAKSYAHATEQLQNWSLFPNVGRDCVFPALYLRWDDGPWSGPPAALPILSDNEPAHIDDFFRLGNYRLRKFEDSLTLILKKHDDESDEEARQRWASRISEHLDSPGYYGEIILAYTRWRLRQTRSRMAEAPTPTQVIFVLRRYVVSLPDEAPPFASGPFVLPVARWRPEAAIAEGDSPLEMYDPVTDQFRTRRK